MEGSVCRTEAGGCSYSGIPRHLSHSVLGPSAVGRGEPTSAAAHTAADRSVFNSHKIRCMLLDAEGAVCSKVVLSSSPVFAAGSLTPCEDTAMLSSQQGTDRAKQQLTCDSSSMMFYPPSVIHVGCCSCGLLLDTCLVLSPCHTLTSVCYCCLLIAAGSQDGCHAAAASAAGPGPASSAAGRRQVSRDQRRGLHAGGFCSWLCECPAHKPHLVRVAA